MAKIKYELKENRVTRKVCYGDMIVIGGASPTSSVYNHLAVMTPTHGEFMLGSVGGGCRWSDMTFKHGITEREFIELFESEYDSEVLRIIPKNKLEITVKEM